MQTKDSELDVSWRLLNPILFTWKFLYCECFLIFFPLEISPELPTSHLLPTCNNFPFPFVISVFLSAIDYTSVVYITQAYNPSPSSLKHAFKKKKKSGIYFIYLFLVVLGLCYCMWAFLSYGKQHVESSQARDQTHIPFMGRWVLSQWTTGEVQAYLSVSS